ncbi:hypothetical protein [Bacillus sp. FJAT-45350]|uniref:hypothetical protein n=1 Tax=Bacillus sp. FJAT-45350 TaxID=2011014 RepID=UPI000BB932F9|nr:hypothetical protein [Bacillus sp. FJAT-45350]
MIRKADVLDRLNPLIGKELTSKNLHEALFCEEKHKKVLRRFNFGTHTYLQYNTVTTENDSVPTFVDITISGNPNTFRMGLIEKEGKLLIDTEPKIDYSYL